MLNSFPLLIRLLILLGALFSSFSVLAVPLPVITPDNAAALQLLSTSQNSGQVYCVAFSPDNQIVAAGDTDGNITLWKAEDGSEIRTISGAHSGTVRSVAFSPNGRILASGSLDNEIKFWNVNDGSQNGDALTLDDDVYSVAFSPIYTARDPGSSDGTMTLASGTHDEYIKLWQLTIDKDTAIISGVNDQSLYITEADYWNYVSSVNFSPDGQILASGSKDGKVRLLKNLSDINDPASLLVISASPPETAVNRVVFSPDGLSVASGSGSDVNIWQVSDGALLRTLNHGEDVYGVAFAPDGLTLASGAMAGAIDPSVKIWQLSDGTLLNTLVNHTDTVRSVTFAPNGQMLASGARDNKVMLWGAACGAGLSYTTGQWLMLALPCVPSDAGADSVANVLGNAPTANLDSTLYDAPVTGWVMYERDVTTSPANYVKLQTTSLIAPGGGYWIKSLSAPVDGKLRVGGTATAASVTAVEGCASANGCMAVTVSTVSGDNRYNLVGNPFPYPVDWAKVRVRIDSNTTTLTPSAAETAGYLSKQIWIWNGTNTYDTWSDISIPNPGNLKYSQSFWVNVLPGAYNHTVELLIPAEASTHGQVMPATDTRIASAQLPWYLGWLDWLMPTAAANDDLEPGRNPYEGSARLDTPRSSAAAASDLMDPSIDLLVTQGISEGLSPEQALHAAHAKAIEEGSEWYIRLKVDQPSTAFQDHNTFIGQLLNAQAGYDLNDLKEMPPFTTPYMTLVIPHADWGTKAGDYGTDYRPATGDTRWALKPTTWTMELRADPGNIHAILSWEGDPRILERSRLRDLQTGQIINLQDHRFAKIYPIEMKGKVQRLTWEFLGIPR